MVLFLPRLAGEKTNMGGLALNTLKKLKGARFGVPFSSTVLAKAMGLGPTLPKSKPWSCGTGRSDGIMVFIVAVWVLKYKDL